MTETRADVTRRRRISAIWLVPIVALVLGLWMVVYTLRSRGPEITITFSSADGIEADKTKIKLRSVVIGVVESVRLADDFESIVVTSRLDKSVVPLLREDTRFWVVRPRVGPGGVSGLGTLLSGGFIQLAPGTSGEERRHFVGLDDPPVTPAGTPGLPLQLVSETAGSVGAGDPILYKGYRVGRIESARFDVATETMQYGAFIEAPYDELVTSSTRFWNESGITVSATANGIEIDTASLEALLIGGVVFGLPDGVSPGMPVEEGTTFELHPSLASVQEHPYRHHVEYVAAFEQSVRGLKPGAPVEYRGIPVGTVVRLLLQERVADGLTAEGAPIPVLIHLEPGRLGISDSANGVTELSEIVSESIANGMRATLATGNLLTGSLYVSLAMYPDEPTVEPGTFAGHPTIPTMASGLAGMEQRVLQLLDKLNNLPIEELLEHASVTITDLNEILEGDSVRDLPQSLDATLVELRDLLESVSGDSSLQQRLLRTAGELDRTLRSLRGVLDTLNRKPNALIFPQDVPEDPVPSAGAP